MTKPEKTITWVKKKYPNGKVYYEGTGVFFNFILDTGQREPHHRLEIMGGLVDKILALGLTEIHDQMYDTRNEAKDFAEWLEALCKLIKGEIKWKILNQ